MTLDEKEFHKQMEEQRQRARKAREALGDLGWAGVEFGKDVPETVFDGYEHDTLTDAKVVALVVENEQAEEMMTGVEGIVVLDKTPFYAEMGGQVADHGQIVIDGDKPCCFEVTDVQKNKGGKYMHYGKVVQGVLKLGDVVRAQIDTQRRAAVMRAHSATHLLDTALRSVLGDHVHQAGSLVEPDRLRFDFTHFSAVTAEELMQVENIVNDAILSGYCISTETLPIEEAKKRGAIALFGEKYGDTVRVVDMGEGFSVEFCGGTHLDNTAKAGMFKIIGEASVAAGVRRIEALTGKAVLQFLNDRQHIIADTAAALKTSPNELLSKVEQTMVEIRDMSKKIEKLNGKLASMQMVDLFNVSRDIKGVNVVAAKLEDVTPEILRSMGDDIKEKAPNMVAVLSGINGEKINLLCVCGAEAVKKGAHAGKIIKEVAKIVGGGGGGRPDSATAGGKNIAKLEDALEAVNNIVDALL
jgi:alanyl-tRNA synthetase